MLGYFAFSTTTLLFHGLFIRNLFTSTENCTSKKTAGENYTGKSWGSVFLSGSDSKAAKLKSRWKICQGKISVMEHELGKDLQLCLNKFYSATITFAKLLFQSNPSFWTLWTCQGQDPAGWLGFNCRDREMRRDPCSKLPLMPTH